MAERTDEVAEGGVFGSAVLEQPDEAGDGVGGGDGRCGRLQEVGLEQTPLAAPKFETAPKRVPIAQLSALPYSERTAFYSRPSTLMGAPKLETSSYLPLDQLRQVEIETGLKHEYVRGEVFAMAGGTFEHSALSTNLLAALKNRLRGRGCRTLNSEQAVRSASHDTVRYPDASVTCGDLTFEPHKEGKKLYLLNPTVLFEVLSPSTEARDRGEKFAEYRSLASLQQYVLIASDRRLVETFTRAAGTAWTYQAFSEGEVPLDSLGIALAVEEVYEELFA